LFLNGFRLNGTAVLPSARVTDACRRVGSGSDDVRQNSELSQHPEAIGRPPEPGHLENDGHIAQPVPPRDRNRRGSPDERLAKPATETTSVAGTRPGPNRPAGEQR